MHTVRGIDVQAVVATEATDRLHMVGMVVGDEHVLDVGEGEIVFPEIFFECSDAYACIDEQSVGFREQVIAVAATTASERDEIQHRGSVFVLCAKVGKSGDMTKVFPTFVGIQIERYEDCIFIVCVADVRSFLKLRQPHSCDAVRRKCRLVCRSFLQLAVHAGSAFLYARITSLAALCGKPGAPGRRRGVAGKGARCRMRDGG